MKTLITALLMSVGMLMHAQEFDFSCEPEIAHTILGNKLKYVDGIWFSCSEEPIEVTTEQEAYFSWNTYTSLTDIDGNQVIITGGTINGKELSTGEINISGVVTKVEILITREGYQDVNLVFKPKTCP